MLSNFQKDGWEGSPGVVEGATGWKRSAGHALRRGVERMGKATRGMLTGRTDARGEVVSFLAGNVDEMVVGGKLIKRSEEFLGFDEEVAVVIVLDLEENVIYAETVIAHGAAEIGEIGLLAREAFENV